MFSKYRKPTKLYCVFITVLGILLKATIIRYSRQKR